MCRVSSATGTAESRAILQIKQRESIEQTSQHPDSLQYIQQLEDYSRWVFCIFAVNEYLIICECRYQRQESSEEKTNQKPHFIRPLQDLGELQEGRNAHFEAQLTPVSDPTMKVRLHQTSFFLTAPNTINTRWSGTKMDDRSPPVAGLLPSSTSATCLSI